MKRVFIALLVVLSPATATAQSSCDGLTQRDVNLCAHQKWEIADRELNRLWKELKHSADARGTGQSLLDEQRAWLRRRDAHCDPELSGGGSAAPMFYWFCMEEQTLQRNQELRALR